MFVCSNKKCICCLLKTLPSEICIYIYIYILYYIWNYIIICLHLAINNKWFFCGVKFFDWLAFDWFCESIRNLGFIIFQNVCRTGRSIRNFGLICGINFWINSSFSFIDFLNVSSNFCQLGSYKKKGRLGIDFY